MARSSEERVPLNDLSLPKRKLEWLAVVAAVELLAVLERAAVVDRDGVAGLRLARAFYGVRDVDCHLCCKTRSCEEAEENWDAHLDGGAVD